MEPWQHDQTLGVHLSQAEKLSDGWGPPLFVSTVGRDEAVIRDYIRHQEHEDQRQEQLRLN